jgi:glycosyltransferase involved in cell wall biosynthesis
MSPASNSPLVSVVCPTFNSAATLRCALRSVLNQDLANFEVHVIGDGCSDESAQVVAQLNDPRVQWFNLARNSGSQGEPNNEGLRRARGKYVAFIGHDDLWFPRHLSTLVEHIAATGADLVHDLTASITLNGAEHVYGPPPPGWNYARLYVPPTSWLQRRDLINEIGYWRDPDEIGWGIDFDYSRRLELGGKRIAFRPSLGTLKFHSAIWRNYSRVGAPPQEQWLTELLTDSKRLAEKVLTQLAVQYARAFQPHDRKPPVPVAWKTVTRAAEDLLKAALRDLTYAYGAERWPLGELSRRRMRRSRARRRIQRGLPSLEESGS